MKSLVTGGAGFIGSTLVDRLLADGREVVVLDNLATGSRQNLAGASGRIDFRAADVRDRAAVAEAVRDVEVVYHLAALAAVARSVENPREVSAVNVEGTLNVLTAAREAGVRRVVFASSSSVYGDTPELPKVETMALTPRSPYAATKAAGEAYMTAFQASYGLETVSLRFFNVYGPRQSARSQYAAVVPRFFESMVSGRPPTIYGDGGQTRDFTWVGDVVDACVRASTAPRACEGPMNLGGGGRISILDLAAAIAAAVDFSGRPIHEPARIGDVRDSLADIRRAEECLRWVPKTSVSDGVAQLAKSFKTAAAVPS